LWLISSDIFTADKFLSSYAMDRPESVNEANQSPSAQIDEPLAPKASEKNMSAGPLASTCP
jgi:hypothetical protein